MTTVGILGTGSYLPGTVVTNEEVGARAGVTDAWITGKTAIKARRWAKPDEATSDLAAIAARAALADAGLAPRDVALVIVATSTPDSPQPPTANAVAAELGLLDGTPAFDINAVCSGFVFALAVAERFLRGTDQHAVVVGADVYSRILDRSDRRTAVLFGDGAGAVVLGPTGTGGLLATRLASFSSARHLIAVPAGGSRIPSSEASLARGLHYFTMDGRAVREFVHGSVGPLIRDFLDEQSLDPARALHFVPHQANGRMIETLAGELGFAVDRTHTTLTQFGNTGAASIPITLDHAADRLDGGDLVVLAGFGGGMDAGLALIEWTGNPSTSPAVRSNPR